MKPALFIGSSRENLNIAWAARDNLARDAETSVWEGIFRIMTYPLESLWETLLKSDFGLFVFAPDDVTRIRGAERRTPRDNVIFEFGLFVGRLGRERCFIILPRGYNDDFHLLSDLSAITPAEYEPPRNPDRLHEELGPACNAIRREMQRKGPLYDLNEYERNHLSNLAQGYTQGYQGQESLRFELRRLRSLGLVQSLPDRSIDAMRDDVEFDLAHYVELTDLGERYSAL
jgi:hypothetical protein